MIDAVAAALAILSLSGSFILGGMLGRSDTRTVRLLLPIGIFVPMTAIGALVILNGGVEDVEWIFGIDLAVIGTGYIYRLSNPDLKT